MDKPRYWFKSIHESCHDFELRAFGASFAGSIEYLKIWTGETFIHTLGTTYWNWEEWEGLDIPALIQSGITHYRLVDL